MKIKLSNIKKHKIVVVTLNPAIDKRWIVDAFKPNTVARVKEVIDSAGGKGVNEARVLHTLGLNVINTGILAGDNGKMLTTLLDKENIKHNFYFMPQGQTRICVNVGGVKDKSQSELLEPGPHVSQIDKDKFINHFKKVINGAKLVSVAGGLPKGINVSFYGELIHICKQQKIKIFIDTSGEALKYSLTCLPNFVKPNVDEIQQLLNKTKFTEKQAIQFAKQQVHKGIDNFVLSLGGRGAILINKNSFYHVMPPKHQVVNTVGCGDTLVAGFIAGELLGLPDKDKISFATACAAAASLTKGTAELHLSDIDKMWPTIYNQ
jgi:tagatose 6-phosphate kinase